MPLTEITQVGRQAWRGLWHVTEDLAALCAFDAEEPPPIITYPQKRQEWKATRLIARQLCDRLSLSFRGIEYDDKRKPHLIGAPYYYDISVAHTFPWVAVIISADKAGIDIERPSQKLKIVAHRFLSKEEYKRVDVQSLTELCLYWCAKEALYKYHGRRNIIFRDDLLVEPFSKDGRWGRLRGTISPKGEPVVAVMLSYEIRPEFVMAFTESTTINVR